MSMVCGLDLHRGQITFDALDVASGEVWRGRIWQPDRQRVRRWLREELRPERTARRSRWRWRVALAGGTWWRRSSRPGSKRTSSGGRSVTSPCWRTQPPCAQERHAQRGTTEGLGCSSTSRRNTSGRA
jgi:hypothetical protein